MAQIDIARRPLELTFSRNPVLFRFKVLPYDQQDIDINTRVVATLYAESEHYRGDFQELKTVSLRPDANGFCEQDWRSLLDAQLEFYVPKPRQTTPQLCKKQVIRYYVRYYISNDYETLVDPATTGHFHVMKGGLAYRSMDLETFFAEKTSLGTDKSFLRFDFNREMIHRDDPLWLYAIAPVDISGNVQLQLLYTRSTTSSTHSANFNYPVIAFKYQIICIPAGIGARWLNLANYAEAVTVSYKAVIQASGVVIGEKKVSAFLIDQYNRYDAKVLNYHNSIGGFDTVAFKGDVEFSAEYTRQDVKLVSVPKFAQDGLMEAIDKQTNSLERAMYKGATGFVAKHKIDRLRDLLNSHLAFEYLAAEQKILPVRVRTSKSALWKRHDQLFNLAIDWDEAWTDSNYTPLSLLPLPSNSCPAVEYFNVSQKSGQRALIHWQLAKGYDMIEVQTDEQTISSPQNNPYFTFLLIGNKGEAEIDLSAIVYVGVVPQRDVRFWARTVCDLASASFGAWTANVDRTIYQFAPPIARNDFANTYIGAAQRALSFANGSNSVLANDTKTNQTSYPLGKVYAVNATLVGSAGGSLDIDDDGLCLYTPVSGTFAGVEVFNYTAYQTINPGTLSPQSTAKIYVTVASGVGSTIQNTGNVFVKLVLTNYATSYIKETHSGNTYNSEITVAKLSLHFFKNPAGSVPYDVSALGLSADIDMAVVANGTPIAPGSYPAYFPSVGSYPNDTPLPGGPYPLTGTSTDIGTVLTRYDKFLAPDIREFIYTIALSPNFFII